MAAGLRALLALYSRLSLPVENLWGRGGSTTGESSSACALLALRAGAALVGPLRLCGVQFPSGVSELASGVARGVLRAAAFELLFTIPSTDFERRRGRESLAACRDVPVAGEAWSSRRLGPVAVQRTAAGPAEAELFTCRASS